MFLHHDIPRAFVNVSLLGYRSQLTQELLIPGVLSGFLNSDLVNSDMLISSLIYLTRLVQCIINNTHAVVGKKKPYEVKVGWGSRLCRNVENTMVDMIDLENYNYK